nr:ATP-binding protein [Acidithiobacillus caldus]
MIRPGDRILLALSGGKDSWSLLELLREWQAHSPIPFALGVATVDPMSPEYDPAPLRAAVEARGLPYYLERQDIYGRAQQHLGRPSYCSFCARMRRGVLYACARREGYNVLALGQHLDDLAESFFHVLVLQRRAAHDEGALSGAGRGSAGHSSPGLLPRAPDP